MIFGLFLTHRKLDKTNGNHCILIDVSMEIHFQPDSHVFDRNNAPKIVMILLNFWFASILLFFFSDRRTFEILPRVT